MKKSPDRFRVPYSLFAKEFVKKDEFWPGLRAGLAIVPFVALVAYAELKYSSSPKSFGDSPLLVLNSLFECGSAGVSLVLIERFMGLYETIGRKVSVFFFFNLFSFIFLLFLFQTGDKVHGG